MAVGVDQTSGGLHRLVEVVAGNARARNVFVFRSDARHDVVVVVDVVLHRQQLLSFVVEGRDGLNKSIGLIKKDPIL